MAKKEKTVKGELIFGIHPVIELLKAGRRKLLTLYTTKPTPKGWRDIERCMPKYPVPIQYVSRDILHRMVQTTDHQGVVAWVTEFPIRRKPFEASRSPFVLMLDGIQDPRNLGAILRSAYCTGVDGVIICKKSAAPLSGIALKASAGLAEHLELYEAPSPQAAAQELIANGYKLYLATLDGHNALQTEFATPLCIVIGSEGAGINKTIMPLGIPITLPQRTADISYNASVAAGILLFRIGSAHKRI